MSTFNHSCESWGIVGNVLLFSFSGTGEEKDTTALEIPGWQSWRNSCPACHNCLNCWCCLGGTRLCWRDSKNWRATPFWDKTMFMFMIHRWNMLNNVEPPISCLNHAQSKGYLVETPIIYANRWAAKLERCHPVFQPSLKSIASSMMQSQRGMFLQQNPAAKPPSEALNHSWKDWRCPWCWHIRAIITMIMGVHFWMVPRPSNHM